MVVLRVIWPICDHENTTSRYFRKSLKTIIVDFAICAAKDTVPGAFEMYTARFLATVEGVSF